MSGTKIGGIKARYTNLERHGLDFYARIGAKGGRNGTTGGFASNPELAKIVGQKGGKNSKRGSSYKKQIEANAGLIIKMYFRDEKSMAEISRMVGIPYDPVRKFVRRLTSD